MTVQSIESSRVRAWVDVDLGALRGVTFVVGPFADSTGKINAVAPGATGNFIPQGGSAAYITDAIAKARPAMIATLNSFRDTLEDLGGGLGVTDAVAGPVVLALK